MRYSELYEARSRTTRRAIRTVRVGPHLQEVMAQAKRAYKELNYAATEPSKFKRTRFNLGGTADAHYQNEFRFWELRENARDMDRNDVLPGAMIDRALDNILGTGLRPNPNTGDKELDNDLLARWEDWSQDPLQCDWAQRMTFAQLERLGLRHQFIDGDVIFIPRGPTAALQALEGDRLTSPGTITDDVVHGVEVDAVTNRVNAYHFSRVRFGRRKVRERRVPSSVDSPDLQRVPRLDDQGRLQVYHVYDPKRFTQSRGVTVFAPMFEVLGMFEDTQFARLVQQQVVSCIAAFITRERDLRWGNRTEETEDDGSTTFFEELSPGLTPRLAPGEDVKGFSPNVPNPEYAKFIRMLIRLIGNPLGMPLELTMMDTTDTTFHGYRGVLQQARRGFKRQKVAYEVQAHRPLWRRLVTLWLAGQRLGQDIRPFRHTWVQPAFPYVDPAKDVEADRTRLRNGMISPRQYAMERGLEWEQLSLEMVDDWGGHVERCAAKAAELNERFKEQKLNVTWREVANLDMPSGMARQERAEDRTNEPTVEETVEKMRAVQEAMPAPGGPGEPGGPDADPEAPGGGDPA